MRTSLAPSQPPCSATAAFVLAPSALLLGGLQSRKKSCRPRRDGRGHELGQNHVTGGASPRRDQSTAESEELQVLDRDSKVGFLDGKRARSEDARRPGWRSKTAEACEGCGRHGGSAGCSRGILVLAANAWSSEDRPRSVEGPAAAFLLW